MNEDIQFNEKCKLLTEHLGSLSLELLLSTAIQQNFEISIGTTSISVRRRAFISHTGWEADLPELQRVAFLPRKSNSARLSVLGNLLIDALWEVYKHKG